MKSVFSKVSQKVSESRRQITTVWQSLSILGKVMILIPWIITIPILSALAIFIFLTLAIVVPTGFIVFRWISILSADYFKTGNMKVPTFYSTSQDGEEIGYIFFMSVAGVVFGGIHCTGWFFNFPSSDEVILWRVSSAVLTGSAFLLPLLFYLIMETRSSTFGWLVFVTAVFALTIIAYVVSRLLLLVEAFISLRYLTPGMLTLVKWTSFTPHI